jgi:GntR family transcriptional regulator/MocR family aminotransferase
MNSPSSASPRPLNARSDVPFYRQLYARLRQAILSGSLRPGSRLPSSRALAEELGIARNTVVNAFEQLRAEGYLTGRLGSGTFVSRALPEHLLRAPPADPHAPATDGLPPALSRHATALNAVPVQLGRGVEGPRVFRHGLPAVDAFPFDLWGRLTARAWRGRPAHLMGYGDPGGHQPLREAIAAYLGTSRGVKCHADQVIVVSGSQQALGLSARLLVDPGDAAWIEDPGYLGARGAFLAAGIRPVPAPVDGEGITLPPDARSGRGLRMAYVTPAHQYPLGVTMSASRRLALIDWAKRSNAWILEDDYDSEFRYAGRPLAALQGIDARGRVIYVGTFSKVLFPALRLGYVVVPESLVDVFVRARCLADGHSPTVVQDVLARFLSAGHFERHVRRMRQLYAERQAVLLRACRRELAGFLEVEGLDAGMHLLGRLAAGVDDRAVARRAAARGVVVTPLSSLCLVPPQRGGLLLGYTSVDARAIREGVRKLADMLSTGI